MSQENVEIVRGLWEPFKGVDLTAVDWDDEAIREMTEQFWSPEVELRWSTRAPDARVYRGREGVIQAYREWLEPFSEYYVEPLDFIEVGDRVVVPQRQWGIGSTSGIAVEVEVTHAYEVRDSQIARVDEYDTLEAALEAAGLTA
jgi:ketosteroid isomerase-like protein